MSGTFVGEDLAEEMMIAEELAVVGGEDDPSGLIGTGHAVVEDPREHEGDRVVDVIHEPIVTGHRVAHRFKAEGADIRIGLQAGARRLRRTPIPVGRAPALIAPSVVVVVVLRRHERRMRCPERQMHKPGTGWVAALLEKFGTFLSHPTGMVKRFFEMKGSREPAVAAETMQVRIDIAASRIVEPIHVIVFAKDGRAGTVVDLLAEDHMIETVALALRKLMQLADELGLVTRFTEQPGHGVFGMKLHAVLIAHHAVGRGVLAGEEGAARGDATRGRGVVAGEIGALSGQTVEVVGLNERITIDAEGIPALLVGGDEEDVGFQIG